MATSVIETRQRTRTPVAALGKLTAVMLAGVALLLTYLQMAIIGEFVPPLAVFALVALVVAAAITAGWRWVPALGTLVCALLLAMNSGPMLFQIMHPGDFRSFSFMAVTLPVVVLGILGGIAATVQNYRHAAGERRMPRLLPAVLIGVTGVVLGAILVAAIPQQGMNVGITPEAIAGLPTLRTKDFMFSQKELHAKVGETAPIASRTRTVRRTTSRSTS